MEQRFHGSASVHERYSQNTLDKALRQGTITEEDRDLLVQFVDWIQGTGSQLSPRRKFKLFYTLIGCRRYLNTPFREVTKTSLIQASGKIKGSSEMAKNTKGDYVRFLKRFYLWMVENGYSDITEREIRTIKSPQYDVTTKTAEMMLSDDEVKDIVGACKTSRDRAFIMLLYEGGFRIGELASLTWSQVKMDEDFALINVYGKTEKPRMVPCRDAKTYLIQYMNDYQIPVPPPRDDLVFWGQWKGDRVQMTYNGMAKFIKEATKRAGIQKKITPHIFRHSSITQAVRDGMGEQVIKSIYWGNSDTAMLKTYSHITGHDILNAVKERYGIETEPKKKKDRKTFGPRQCKLCGHVNVPTNKFCGKCAAPLTMEVAGTLKEAEKQAELQPEYKELLEEFEAKLRSIQQSGNIAR